MNYKTGILDERRRIAQEALVRSGGNVVRAAKDIGVSHRTLCRWVASDQAIREALDAARAAKSG